MVNRSENAQSQIHRISSKNAKTGKLASEDGDSMEIDDDRSSVSEVRTFSVLCFVREVFMRELGDYAYDIHDDHTEMLLGITVRAALSDSGFVEIDPVSKSLKRNSSFNAQRGWYFSTFYFTLPNINVNGKTETVKIRFQNLGRYCTIYGCLVDGTTVYSVLLDKANLTFFLSGVWADFEDVIVVRRATNRVSNIQPKNEVLKIWRKVKDELVLPLLTDLCNKVGLEPPLCFMELPVEIKLKILDSVSGVDMARLSCVCSKLRSLVSSGRLWRQKYCEQFGGWGCVQNDRFTYKELYARSWKNLLKWKKRLRRSF